MKKTPPEKLTTNRYGDSSTYTLFSYAKYQGKTDAELEKLYAEERKEEQRRKKALEKIGEHNNLA
jgi:hypothetical protein